MNSTSLIQRTLVLAASLAAVILFAAAPIVIASAQSVKAAARAPADLQTAVVDELGGMLVTARRP